MASRVIREAASVSAAAAPISSGHGSGRSPGRASRNHADHHDDDDGQLEDEQLPGERAAVETDVVAPRSFALVNVPDVTT